jgi:NADH-quinone oxidoreductase subunit F/NADP-reducing hydrogenase subunit HndC
MFVCTYGAWCKLDGADDVRARLKDAVKEAGLASEVRVTKSGCLGQCGNGPMAVAWPDNVWYCRLTPDDVPGLLEHVKTGRVLEARRYRPLRPGTNKTEAVMAKEAEKGKHVE